jgi:hypothetical protein
VTFFEQPFRDMKADKASCSRNQITQKQSP